MSQLSEKELNEISKEAKAYALKWKAQASFEGLENIASDYIAGATAERHRAKELYFLVELIADGFPVTQHNAKQALDTYMNKNKEI